MSLPNKKPMIFKCFPMQPEKTMKIWKRGSAAFPTDIPKEILEEFQKISRVIYFFGDVKSLLEKSRWTM
jgi:hypothetical protein